MEFFSNKTIITNEDYLHIIDKYKDNGNAFLYLDPPYLDSYNSGYGTYQNKSHDMYIKFLDILKNGKCKMLFSINDCALTNYLYKGDIKETYNHKYQHSHLNIKKLNEGKKKKNANVFIISNF